MASKGRVAYSTLNPRRNYRFNTSQHARETAIRKVMGCSRGRIFAGMAGGFLSAVCIAAVIGIPCSYFITGKWLEGYPYRIDNSLWIYIAAALVLMAVAIAAITWQTVRLMNTDPAEALKNE